MKNLFVLAMVAVALTVFNGCQKEEPAVIGEQPQAAVTQNVQCINGFLVFANSEQLSKTLNLIETMTEEERRSWEEEKNFISQFTMFQDIVNAELLLDEPYKNLDKDDLKKVIPPPKHSETYFKYLEMGIIKEYTETDGGKIYDYATSAPYLVSILDENGVFVVGDTMYQYAPGAIKKWSECDINNKKMLINTSESTSNIEVSIQLKSATVKYGDWQYDSSRKRRIRIGINFNSYQYYSDGTVWNYTHWVEAQSQKKNFWGHWKYNTTTMYIIGTWDYSITFGNQYYPEGIFQNTTGYYDYPNPRVISASNYKSSCSISTGTIYPYGSIMSIMTDGVRDTGSFKQEDLKVIYDVKLTDYYWEVTGHSYVTATVEY